MIDKSILDGIIVGRVDPHIYAFTTRTVPNYLKVGDTYRPVSERLQEWRKYFPQLQKEFEGKAKVSDNVYFRDFSVHEFLEREKRRKRFARVFQRSDGARRARGDCRYSQRLQRTHANLSIL